MIIFPLGWRCFKSRFRKKNPGITKNSPKLNWITWFLNHSLIRFLIDSIHLVFKFVNCLVQFGFKNFKSFLLSVFELIINPLWQNLEVTITLSWCWESLLHSILSFSDFYFKILKSGFFLLSIFISFLLFCIVFSSALSLLDLLFPFYLILATVSATKKLWFRSSSFICWNSLR